MAKALATYGLPEPDLERFDQKRPPLWDSLQVQRRKFHHFLQAVIYGYGRKGKVIIMRRGGQVLLEDLPGAFHLSVVARFEVRLR